MASEGSAAVTVVADPRLRGYEFGPSHPFQVSSRWLAVRLLEEEGFFIGRGAGERLELAEVPMATRAELLRFHLEEYLDRVDRAGDGDGRGFLDRGDTPAFPGCYGAASRVAGATLSALGVVLDSVGRRAFQPAGGLHHAHPGRASGFCIFNDVALAIATAIGPRREPRVAYIDIDAHHGDGVMYGFYDDGRVLDIDFHQDGRTLFPGTGAIEETGRGDGAGTKVNIPLPPGAGDRTFETLFLRVVPSLLRSFRPHAIVLQCGVDAHRGDGLAQLEWTPRSYELAVTTLAHLSDELCSGRLLVTGGGGYNAASVSRVLGRVPSWLVGEHPPPERTLPASWRREFEGVTGGTSPSDCTVLAVGPAERDAVSDRLLQRLSAVLGRSFPGG
ncbi:MAG: acetoin utilization protein AcuC [Thermoplasmata archaeon]|nr:acetoin utilization protein AcuC [Thermoplasmata archaeon]